MADRVDARPDPPPERPRPADDRRIRLNAATRNRTRQASFSLPKLRASSFVLARRPGDDDAGPADVPWGFDPDTKTLDARPVVAGARSRFMPVSRSLSMADRRKPVGLVWNGVRREVGEDGVREREGGQKMQTRLEVEVGAEVEVGKDADVIQEVEEEIVSDFGGLLRGVSARVVLDPGTPPVQKPRHSGQLFKSLTGRNKDDKSRDEEHKSYVARCECKDSPSRKETSKPVVERQKNGREHRPERGERGSVGRCMQMAMCKERPKMHDADRETTKDRERFRCHNRVRPHMVPGLFRRAQSSNSRQREGRDMSESKEKMAISPVSDDKSPSLANLSLNRWRSRNVEVGKEKSLVKSSPVQPKKDVCKIDDQESSKRSLRLPHWKGFCRKGKQKADDDISEEEEEEILVIADVVNSLAHDDFIDFQAHLKQKGRRHRFRPRRGSKRDGDSDN